jgi:uncharacterized protein (TIGR03000 family)
MFLVAVGVSWLAWVGSSEGFGRRRGGWAPTAPCDLMPLVLWQLARTDGQGGGPAVDRESHRVHFLLLLDSRDPAGGAEASEEAVRLEHLIFSLPRIDRGTFTAIQGDALTRDNVLKAIREMPVGPNEALVVWGSLRGAKTPEKAEEQPLPMASGPALPRQELIEALRAKKARLGVLITDASGPSSSTGEPVIRRRPPATTVTLRVGPAVEAVLHDLLVSETGLVSMASAAPGEHAFHGVLAPAFIELCENWDELRDGKATWETFFPKLTAAAGRHYAKVRETAVAKGTASKEMTDQKAQTPVKLETKKKEEKDEAGATAPARLIVQVPAGARLWIDDRPTQQTESLRIFETPELKSGRSFSYVLRAEIDQGGKTVTESRRVEFRAGETIEVEFAELQAVVAGSGEKTEITPAPAAVPE